MLSEYRFRVAIGSERQQALDLQHRVYLKEAGYSPADQFDDSLADFLIAVDAARNVCGAFRIVRPEYRPFDLERFVDLSDFFPPERTIALIGRLCIRPENRTISNGGFLPLGLWMLAYEFAASRDITDYVMYSFPKLRRFYQSGMFERLEVSFYHPGFGCDLDVMRLDIDSLRTGEKVCRPWGKVLTDTRWDNIDV